jgi:tRNA dimethylallyltransferase
MSRLLAIVGPTAVGKSGLALRLARELDAEIVNADALQVYRGLDVGTAKPTPEERALVPHHMVDVLDPEERCSAGEYARRAREVVRDVQERGKLAIVVGGSGLYLRALLDGLSPLPRSAPEVRRRLEERLREEGLPALYGELREVDPETAERLAPGDRQRILRALEVALGSGRTLSSWIRSQPPGQAPLPAVRWGLTMPRDILYDRIAGRVQRMVERGWVDEVERLLTRGIDPRAPAFQAIGYRQLVRHVLGEWELEAALDDTIRATRRYAKRQATWFRKEKGVRWISAPKRPEAGWESVVPSLLDDLVSELREPSRASSLPPERPAFDPHTLPVR